MKSFIKIIAIVAGILIGVFSIWYYFVNNTTFPEKVLMVGEQVDDNGRVHFYKEIKEVEKINQYEKFYHNIGSTYEGGEPDGYPDFIVRILKPESVVTHSLNVWVEEDGVVALKSDSISRNFITLSSAQYEKLKEMLGIN